MFFALNVLSAVASLAPQLPNINYSHAPTTVVVFTASTCPCSQAHEPELQKLRALHPDYQFVELKDADLKTADAFGALKTPHAYVIDSEGKILYSGGITDRSAPGLAHHFYLRDVLAAIHNNKEIPWKRTRTLGCLIRR